MPPMGYVFDFKDAIAWERWLNDPNNRDTLALEHRLMMQLLNPVQGCSVLDIGCGIGSDWKPLADAGLTITGLDPSPYMLDIAEKHAPERIALHRGVAEDLPFDDNEFHYAMLNTTLEFVDDPYQALAEACRVAKDRIFLGVMNKFALKGFKLRVKGFFQESIYNHARFFSVWELKKIIFDLLGEVPVAWRTVCLFPGRPGGIGMHLERLEQLKLVQKSPFGAYTGMAVTLKPRYRTKPLEIFCPGKRPTGLVTG